MTWHAEDEAPAARAGPRKISRTEHKKAFEAYVRKGETHGLFDLEAKSMSIGSNPDGGYLVPAETESEIGRLLSNASPIRAISDVRQVSAAVYKKPFAITGAATGWVGETAARPETASATLAELQFPAMELYAMPAATQALLDDSGGQSRPVDRRGSADGFRRAGEPAFVTGNGTNRPRASPTIPRWPTRAGAGAIWAISPPAWRAALPPRTPPTS